MFCILFCFLFVSFMIVYIQYIFFLLRCICLLVKLTLRFHYSRWSFECSNRIFISPSYCSTNTALCLFYWNWCTSVRKHLKPITDSCPYTQQLPQKLPVEMGTLSMLYKEHLRKLHLWNFVFGKGKWNNQK